MKTEVTGGLNLSLLMSVIVICVWEETDACACPLWGSVGAELAQPAPKKQRGWEAGSMSVPEPISPRTTCEEGTEL